MWEIPDQKPLPSGSGGVWGNRGCHSCAKRGTRRGLGTFAEGMNCSGCSPVLSRVLDVDSGSCRTGISQLFQHQVLWSCQSSLGVSAARLCLEFHLAPALLNQCSLRTCRQDLVWARSHPGICVAPAFHYVMMLRDFQASDSSRSRADTCLYSMASK